MQKEHASGANNTNNLQMGRDIQERTFNFAVDCVKLCRALEKQSATCRSLANQLLRSATSVGANVEEAQAGQSRADFVAKLSIALKEARETHYWLRLLQAAEISSDVSIVDLQNEADQIKRVLGAIIVSARRSS